ncbi:hypothetical protein IQ22_00666 [Pseudomonas duriflava]|uniref:Uncharacterized protein n=1 Tax=Pseudomonas duriflava TaxID=459528 RepID=A0A562QMM1_9PSED|nr:hypothetical protein [Pseudomonas duriflava]TWI57450.1 hypothetical protein IQ22_00666 [Pseudomonas duriflava]
MIKDLNIFWVPFLVAIGFGTASLSAAGIVVVFCEGLSESFTRRAPLTVGLLGLLVLIPPLMVAWSLY